MPKTNKKKKPLNLVSHAFKEGFLEAVWIVDCLCGRESTLEGDPKPQSERYNHYLEVLKVLEKHYDKVIKVN